MNDADGFFHALLKGIYSKYSETSDPEVRKRYVQDLRQDLAKKIEKYHKVAINNDKATVDKIRQKILYGHDFDDFDYEYFSKMLRVNILFAYLNDDLELENDFIPRFNKEKETVILTNKNELVGVRNNPGKIQTWFSPGDNLLEGLLKQK